MLNVVVARHQEDLDWLNRLPADAKIHVYNAGPALEGGALRAGTRIESIRSRGRASAYLAHLRTHFHPADGETTVFTHADPFEQAPALVHLLQQSASWLEVQPLSAQRSAAADVPARHLLDNDLRDWIGELPIRAERYSLQTWTPLASFDEDAAAAGRTYRAQHALPAGVNLAEHFLDLCGLNALADAARDGDVGVYAYGSIFAVRNARIEQFMRRYGRQLATMETLARADPNYDAMFERCWLHLYGEPFVRLPALRSETAAAPGTAGTADTAASAAVADQIAAIRRDAYEAWGAGRAADARALLQRVLHHDPRNVEVLADFATFALQAGEFKLAARYARSALAVEPGHLTTRFTLAMALARVGETAEAATAFDALLQGPAAVAFHDQQPELAALARAEASRLRIAA